MKKQNNIGLTLAIASPCFFAVFNIGLRLITQQMTVWGIMFIRGFLGIAVVLLAAKIMRYRLNFSKLGLLLSIGLISISGSASNITAISKIPLYQAIVILYLYPAFSVILGYLINRDKIGLMDCLGVAVAFTGCVLLVWPNKSAGLEFSLGHILSIVGACLYSLTCVLTRRIGQDSSGLEPFLAFSVFGALLSWPLSQFFGVNLAIDSGMEVLKGTGVALLGCAGQLMAFAALRFLPAYKVGVIGSLEILGSAMASWLLFNDPMTIRTIIGGAIIFYAAFGFRTKRP
ncbi:MAG: DMT family transporter [Deltaproteobacteria bacterium]|jgi:drug/metabolite transporter (DMT)-like permease|nr:DMT family transporter [Deltaproteobacteria bacterium]